MRDGKGTPRGISLLEVLISMFVLLIGLVGVSAMIPAGRFEIMQGVKMDYAAMIGRAAIRDLKLRGYLNPVSWQDASGTALYTPANSFLAVNNSNSSSDTVNPTASRNRVTPAIAIDPLGLAAGFTNKFPNVPTGPTLTRLVPHPQVSSALLADPIFRCADDLVLTPNGNKDLPPLQQMMGAGSKRSSFGNYSWLATVVTPPDGTADGTKVKVSVAVFSKRDLSSASNSESSATVTSWIGSELVLNSFTSSPPRPVRPAQWIMVAYVMPPITDPKAVPYAVPATLSYANWYRVVAADNFNGTQQAITVSGPDIPSGPNGAIAAWAWIFENVTGVYEKNLKLDWN